MNKNAYAALWRLYSVQYEQTREQREVLRQLHITYTPRYMPETVQEGIMKQVHRPAMALRRLDLPQPEGPTMSKELPACRVMLRLRHSCRDLVGVNMLRERRVRPACRRWLRTMREEDAFVSVKAAHTTYLAHQGLDRRGELKQGGWPQHC